MKIEDLFERIDEDPVDITLEIEDRPGRLQTNIGEPVKFLYRIVSKEEYDDIKETGMMKASGFYGRIHATAIPTGGEGNSFKVLKIKYDPADGWKPKQSSTGVYAVTWNNVSVEKIVGDFPISVVRTNELLLKTRFNQYMEYQAR